MRLQAKLKLKPGRYYPFHRVTNSPEIRHGRNRETHAESIRDRHLPPTALSTSYQAPPSNSGPLVLPILSFSSECIFSRTPSHCDAASSSKPNYTHPREWNDSRIRAVTHPNSPYVPWSEHQRQWIFSSAETLGDKEATSINSHEKPIKEFYALHRGSFWCKILEPIARRFQSLCCSSKRPTNRVDMYPIGHCSGSTTTLSSIQTYSLEDWLAGKQQEMSVAESVRRYATLDDYERSGSWIHPPNPLQYNAPDFSLDFIPSPSPTIISFSCAP